MNSDRAERIRRMPPERTGPIRNATAMFRPNELIPPRLPPTPNPRHPETDASPVGSRVESAVNTAYRVLDDALSRGREAARRHSRASSNALPANGRRGDFKRLSEDAVRLCSDIMTSCLDFVEPLARTVARPFQPEPKPEQPSLAISSGLPSSGGPLRVALDVSSPMPIEVFLDISPGAEVARLAVQDLRSLEGSSNNSITGIRFDLADGRSPRLRVRVSSGQPAGTYLGFLYDTQTAEPRGSLRVVLHP